MNTRFSARQKNLATTASVISLRDLSGSLMNSVGKNLLRKYRGDLSGPLLRRVLDDAAETAFATGFPHLFFPELAAEKVRLTSRAIADEPVDRPALRSAA